MSVISSRAPLRISLGGGGTDLPSYYREHGGFLVAGAIDKYVYMLVHTIFQRRYRMKYSEIEEVDDVREIRHPILRETLLRHWRGNPLEIASLADVPAGTGLGSSGAYTVCLLKALAQARHTSITPRELGDFACEIEIDVLGEPVGKQDQFVAAHGGICSYTFNKDDTTDVEPLELDPETLRLLRDNLLLFYTGDARSASRVLSDQDSRSKSGDADMIANLHRTKELGYQSRDLLLAGELVQYGQLMDEHWQNKRRRSPGMANEHIDHLYDVAMGAGAVGGKLVGAGGGGFLLVYTQDPQTTRAALEAENAEELVFDFEFSGRDGVCEQLTAGDGGHRVAIIGCGLIGKKRARALGDDRLIGAFDVDAGASAALVAEFGGVACRSIDELLSLSPDIVVVATIHSALAAHAIRALEGGAHVLVEKPAGIGVTQIDAIDEAARSAGRLVKVGFNHRFHPGISRAIETARSGIYGEVLSFRGRYGHGGRLGYDREWRADPSLSGGGEVVDQGMHLLDLSLWLQGPLPAYSAMLRTQYWQMPVDDNAVLILGEPGGAGSAAPFSLLAVSWTEWKNTFSIEIACRTAKIAVDGLGGSYGTEHLRIYAMRPELGPPDLIEERFEGDDVSWSREWAHFIDAIDAPSPRPLLGDLGAARYCWQIVESAQGQ